MPSRATVNAFVTAVEHGDYVDAIERYYHDDASTQENLNPPRVGRDTIVEHEKKTLAQYKVQTHPTKHVVIDGDTVVINWIFEMTDKEGRIRHLNELALQTWKDEKILREQFYYDPTAHLTDYHAKQSEELLNWGLSCDHRLRNSRS